MNTLEKIIENLKKHEEIDAVFLTGSYGIDHKTYSDIDLVIVLNKSTQNIKSLYTWIDDKFADVFFFDSAELDRIGLAKDIHGNKMDGVFVTWLGKAVIQFDKTGKVAALKEKMNELNKVSKIPESEKKSFYDKINYNWHVNKRYFDSNDSIYHEALEIRLLYSVSEIFTGYFEFRDILWRGEKAAIKYLKENDMNFYSIFVKYTKADDLREKYFYYSKLVDLVFTDNYKPWVKGGVYPQEKDREAPADNSALINYWNNLTS